MLAIARPLRTHGRSATAMNIADFHYPSESVSRVPPANLASGDEPLFAAERTRSYRAVRAVNVEHVRVHADGICLRRAGPLLLPTLVFPQDTLSVRHAVKAALMLQGAALRGSRGLRYREHRSGLLLTDLYLGGFFHWFTEILPKVAALVDAGVKLDAEPVLVPACRDAAYVGESLAAFGLRAQVIQPAEYAAVERLHFIPRLTPSGNVRPAVMRRLAETVRRHARAGPGSGRIYVTRRQAAKRQLLNEAEILPLLQQYGFRVVCMEELSLAEQVRLAAGSTVIAGLHGAGLTHMLWMPAGGQVLEIRAARDRHNNCYYGLASDLGHSYHYVFARKQSPLATSQWSNFVVNVGRFEQALLRMFQANAQ